MLVVDTDLGCGKEERAYSWPSVQQQKDRQPNVLRPELDVGPIFLTRPNPTHKWSDPTRHDPELTWNSGPDLAQPIYARLLVLPSAAESFSLSTK